MSKKLDNIRTKIDEHDNTIHDVLMERAELIVDVVKEKKKHGIQFVQPAREATMIRRLLKRHKGALPPVAIVRIWRELVGAVSLLQTGLKVSVNMEEGDVEPWGMAKDYFGSVVPMQKSSNPLAAIASVREDESSFAVLPWPEDGEESPWWTHLFNQDQDTMRVVCALPYGSIENESSQSRALVISKIDYASSGEDNSFIVLEIDQSASRARIVDALKELKFEPLSMYSKRDPDSEGHSLYLIELNDYVPNEDERLSKISEKFESLGARCMALGGYPVPPVYKALAQKEEVLVAPVKKEKKRAAK